MGGGEVADWISSWLDYNEITYEAKLLSKDYCKANKDISIEEYVLEHKCNIVVGFRGYKQELLESLNRENIVNIYALDIIGRYPLGLEYDSIISKEMIELYSNEISLLIDNLVDKISFEYFIDFIHQRMQGTYEKKYSVGTQYFEKDIIRFDTNEVFVDCGGFDGGDTANFLDFVDDISSKAFIFEPDPENYSKIKERFKKYNNVKVFNNGVSDSNAVLKFDSGKKDRSKVTEEGNVDVQVGMIDDYLHDEKVTFIKMDVEGYELLALRGAKETIIKNHPKMAICIYHKAEDVWEIPQYILSLDNSYSFYIRSYKPEGVETILYAI